MLFVRCLILISSCQPTKKYPALCSHSLSFPKRNVIYYSAQIFSVVLVTENLSLSSLASLFIIISVLTKSEKESIMVSYQAIAQSRRDEFGSKKGK